MGRVRLENLDPQPAGFGNCGSCAYRDVGSAEICFTCASRTIEPVSQNRCVICDQRLDAESACTNKICTWPEERRHFDLVFAIAMRSGELERAINSLKFYGRWGWAAIFGRVLVGYLDANREIFETTDLIVASPGFGERRHTEEVIKRAAIEAAGRWPFDIGDPAAIIKVRETERFVHKGWNERAAIAETQLRDALHVPDIDRVAGRDILVYDDVFTEGLTIREVARALKLAGARRVTEIVLARQPWRGW